MARIKEVKEIPLEDLQIGRGQVRLRQVSKEIDELADSIRKVGLLEPIVVCETETPGKFEIITGQRRFMAHQDLKADKIMAAILDEMVDEPMAKVLSVTENLVRRDLNSRDLIDACTYLYRKYGTMKAVAEETGLPYNKVTKYVKYDQLIDSLKELIDSGQVKMDTALRAQQAASVSGGVNEEEAVIFAKAMSPLSGAQGQKMVDTRRENPSMSVDDIIEDAKSGGRITQIRVTLTADVHTGLSKYAESSGTTVDDAAGTLIRESLEANDFIGDSP